MGKITFISLEEMEQITQGILRNYGFDFENQHFPVSVPIDEIIEFHYDLDIHWEPIDHFDPSGLVMAAIIPSDRRIIMNETCREFFEEKIGTMHFTMAHELGHWVLHVVDKESIQITMDIGDSAQTFYCRSQSKKMPVEFQADMFAGSILMPKPMIQKVIGEMKAQGRIQLKQLYSLVSLFKVSISALSVRLEQLDLLYIADDGKIYDTKNESLGQVTFDK